MGASESHLERMKELENESKRMAQQRQKELNNIKKANRQILTENIQKYETRMNNLLLEMKKLKQDLIDQELQKNIVETEKLNFNDRKMKAISDWKFENKFDDIKQNLENAKKEIKAAIQKTSVSESNVGEFLNLTHELINGTTKNQIQANKLAGIIETFHVTLTQNVQKHLSIETYFTEKKLERLIPIFEEQGMDTMNELICDNDEEFKELIDEIDEDIQEQINTWEETKENKDIQKGVKPEKITPKEKRKLKKICKTPKLWQDLEKQQHETAKRTLESIAPVLSKFFNRTYETMNLADKILSIGSGSKLNVIQQDSIQDMQNLNLKQIGFTSKIQQKEENNKNNNNNNMKIQKSNNIILEENELLNQAAIISINVLASMEDDFEKCGTTGKSLAEGVENSCRKLVESQGSIRESWVLANEIYSLKPSNLNKESKPLWDEVDKGVIQIYQNILSMSKVSAIFFGFFIKFSNSFNYFVDANKQNVDLTISMQHIIKNAKDFKKFSVEFEKHVQKLEKEALDVIGGCVRNGKGAKQFNEAKKQRDINKKLFDDLWKELNKKECEWEKRKLELEKKYQKIIRESKSLAFQLELAQKNYELDQEAKKRFEKSLLKHM